MLARVSEPTNNTAPPAMLSEPAPAETRIDLLRHAEISAEIAEGDGPAPAILKRHGLTDQEWTEATRVWMQALADDVQTNGIEAKLAIQYSDRFAEHQQQLKPAEPYTPEMWAELEYELERSDTPEEPLARRQLSAADYMRLVRIYAKRVAEEPEVAMRMDERRAALEGATASSPTEVS